MLHTAEDAGQRCGQFGFVHKIPIVCSGHASMMPQSFRGVELWRVRRQVIHFPPRTIGLEPFPHIAILVVGGVVLNVKNGARIIMARDLFEEIEIGLRIEHRIAMIQEARRINFDATENLDAFALARHGNLWLTTASGPGAVKG